MADIVNLRQRRKRQARAEKARQAEANRLRHGRSGAERQRNADATANAAAKLEQHRLESGVRLAQDPAGGETPLS